MGDLAPLSGRAVRAMILQPLFARSALLLLSWLSIEYPCITGDSYHCVFEQLVSEFDGIVEQAGFGSCCGSFARLLLTSSITLSTNIPLD